MFTKLFPAVLLLTILCAVVLGEGVLYAQQTERAGETTYEQAYVPCGTKDENPKDGIVDNPCQFSHIIELAKKLIMGWIIAGVIIATMGFAYAGLLYITAMGAQEKISHAHSIFVKTFWGFVFMLSAWLIAYTMEKIFLTEKALQRSFLEQPAK